MTHTAAPAGLVERIDALLPQTQCTRCGYPACRAYAQAIAQGEADINQCPPGGAAGIRALAMLLGRETLPLNPANGVEKPAEIALIDEDTCIGCVKCIDACPVDAIVGAAKMLHTVLVQECSGCELCVPACPVDCISMIEPTRSITPTNIESAEYSVAESTAVHYRRRYEARQTRLARQQNERNAAIAARKADVHAGGSRNTVLEAIARAKAKKKPIV